MPKKLSVLFGVLVLILSLGSTASASAAPAVQNCNGKTLVSANYVRNNAGAVKGAVQLCRDEEYWFAMFFYYGDSLPTGHIGTARLFRRDDTGEGVQESHCAEDSGNAVGTRTWCFTMLVFTGYYEYYRARGELYSNRTGSWVRYASGSTLLCNAAGCIKE